MGTSLSNMKNATRLAWLGVAIATVIAPPALAQQERQLLPLLPGPLPTDYGLLLELPEAEFPGRFWFGAGVDVGHDNNVFRLQDGLSPPGGARIPRRSLACTARQTWPFRWVASGFSHS